MAEADSVTVGNITVALSDVPTHKANRIPWILECGCEPMAYHCDQCDARRKARTKVEKQESFVEGIQQAVADYGWEVMVTQMGGTFVTTAEGFEAWWSHD